MPSLEDEQDSASRAPRSRRRPPWWLWVALGVVALVVLIAGLGGFRDVPITALPKVQLGETFVGNEVDSTVTSVYLTKHAPGQTYDADDGMQYLIVEVSATNTSNEPSLLTRSLVRVLLDGVLDPYDEEDEFGGAIDTRTGDQTAPLQPGLLTTIVYRWDVPDSVKPGDEVIIGIFERHRVYGDPIWGDDSFSTGAVARVLTTIGAQR